MKLTASLIALGVAAAIPVATQTASADILEAAPDGFVLRYEQQVTGSAAQRWELITHPEHWWLSDHTYSGDNANLSLDLIPGGCWCENWEEGGVEHGRILTIQNNQKLVLSAPFGPLQGLGVNAVMTIWITDLENDTSQLSMEYVVTGASFQNLDDIAPIVDAVQAEAFDSLASGH